MGFEKAMFVTVDFESWNANMWWTCAFVAMEYQSGTVLDIVQFACDRSDIVLSTSTHRFWERHNIAFQINTQNGAGKSVDEEELKICGFIETLKKKNPSFYLICDSPTSDVLLLDNILQRYGYPTISQRSTNIFHQPICTWSYRLAISQLLDIQPRNIVRVWKNLIHQRPIEIEIVNNSVRFGNVVYTLGPTHTPLTDCFRILLNHFKILDIANNMVQLTKNHTV